MHDHSAIGHVDFSFTSNLRPWDGDPEQYWVELKARIMALPEEAPDDADLEPAGKMRMLLVRVAEARDDSVSLFEVFDSHMQGLHEVYCALFDNDEEIKPDLGIEPFAHEVLWVQSLKLDARYQQTSLAAQAIETAASVLVTIGIVIANADLPLTLDDWLNLGFHKIAGEKGFYIWDRSYKNRYGRKRE